jgi:hypothetical protein
MNFLEERFIKFGQWGPCAYLTFCFAIWPACSENVILRVSRLLNNFFAVMQAKNDLTFGYWNKKNGIQN